MTTNYPVLIWLLAVVFMVAEVIIVVSTLRAYRHVRAAGETRLHNMALEIIWVLLPGLALAALFVWSLLSTTSGS